MSKFRQRFTGRLCALGLIVLAPVCAEYIAAYDDSTGNPIALAAGLVVFVPLYGAAALLIRELSRRFGVGWPGMLALATACGVLQAGIIDQSMFNDSYRDIGYWEAMIAPTWIEPLGLSANAAMGFVAGHMLWSFCVPIAVTEAIGPKPARPWLGWPGLCVTAVLYLAGAAVVLQWHLDTEGWQISAGQLAGTLGVVAVLVVSAFAFGRRRTRERRERRTPAVVAVWAVSLAVSLEFNLLDVTVTATVIGLALLSSAALAVTYLSGSVRWSPRHVAALASGALLGPVITGFLAEPIGDVSAAAQLGHNMFFLVMALGLGLWAHVRAGAYANTTRDSRSSEGI